MKRGYLSEYFEGVAVKRLSAVEAHPERSNQHEFDGVQGLRQILGESKGKQKFDAKFIYLSDSDAEPVVADGFLTWYDARERHPSRSEYRLYFPTTAVSQCAAEGDLLVIGKRPSGAMLVIVAEQGSTIERQIQWLFGFSDLTHPGFSVKSEIETDQTRLEFASRFILEQLGIEVENRDETWLETLLREFEGTFPGTRVFSAFARNTMKEVSPLDDPDAALLAWLEREEVLFRTLERHLIADRLRRGFGDDPDAFIEFSLSVQNRRKSRAGSALENHLEEIFVQNKVHYSRGQITENRARPDFVFPGISEYHDPKFSAARLTMLGAKATCKDRWRQVLAEADRISEKHLLTLEPGISENQTSEMQSKRVRLVVPAGIARTYSTEQQGWLLKLTDFIGLVLSRQ
ncbi:MAG: type II restriction endonuclease [Nitrospira sp.]|nr:type II restriction endonuclease [Nitrospira sp.]